MKTAQNLCFPSFTVVTMDATFRRKCVRYPDVIKAAQLIVQSMRLAQKKKKNSGAKLAVRALAAVLLPAFLLSDINVLCNITHFLRCSGAFWGIKCRLRKKDRAEVSRPCLRGSR